MQLSAGDIARLIDGELSGDAAQPVTGVAGVREARPGDLTFVAHPKYFAAARHSRASVLMAARDAAVEFSGAIIRVADPVAAFARVVQHITPPPVKFATGISPRAQIHPSAKLGAAVSIQPFVVIEEGVVIGDRAVIGAGCYLGHGARLGADCLLYPSVTLRERTVIGDRVILHSGVVLGADGFGFELKQGRHEKIPQLGSVAVGDDVEIGANSAIDRGRFGVTRIGNGTKIDNLVQIGHNCVIGEHCVICGLVGMAGSTILGDYVTIAGQVGIAGHLTIGDKAIVMAQSGVSKDVAPNSIVLGSPAAPHREFKTTHAALQRLPQTLAKIHELERELAALRAQHAPVK